MNKRIVMWAAVMALVSAPVLSLRAQEEPGDEEEIEINEDGPGQPEMQPGMDQGRGQREPWMRSGMGQGQNRKMHRLKKIIREGKEEGGHGFMQEEAILAVINKHDPALAKKMEDLRNMAPGKYRMVLLMSGRVFGMARMEQDESIEKDAVRAISLEFDTREMSLRYDKASDADKKAIKESLKAKLGELFDLKNRGQELRLKQMEKKISRLRKNLEGRKASKDKIVGQRLEEMTGEGHGW